VRRIAPVGPDGIQGATSAKQKLLKKLTLFQVNYSAVEGTVSSDCNNIFLVSGVGG
jgi:hypothetical protein